MPSRKILAVVPDLLISVRIEEAGRPLDAVVETAPAKEAPRLIAAGGLSLVIIDLSTAGRDLEAVASSAREFAVPVAGFYPHVDAGLRRRAKAAGIKRVYARSRFLRELTTILRAGLSE